MLANPSVPWHDQVVSPSKLVDNYVNLVILIKQQHDTLSSMPTADYTSWCQIDEIIEKDIRGALIHARLILYGQPTDCLEVRTIMMRLVQPFQSRLLYESIKWHGADGEAQHNHPLWLSLSNLLLKDF